MKKGILMSFLLLLVGTYGFGQKKMSEGSVMYKCTEVKGGGMQAFMMKGSTQTFYFGKVKHRISINAMAGQMKTDIISNTQKGNGVMYMQIPMMGKYKVNMTKEDQQESKAKMPNYTVKYDKKDKKKIKGYKCYKAVLTSDKGDVVNAYITNKITPNNSPFKDMFANLNGFPMEFEVKQGDMKMRYEAKTVSPTLEKNSFTISSKGYEEMTMTEFKKKMSKWGGSMGGK